MEECRIRNFEEFYEVLRRYRHNHRWKFRGQSHKDWKLIPKVGRTESWRNAERFIFTGWKTAALAHLPIQPADDWGWLAIGQHHDLATRMLDWTHHALTAAFFAVSTDIEADAAVYAYRPENVVGRCEGDPLTHEGIVFYSASTYVPRIGSQAALFTVHGPPNLALEDYAGEDHLHKIVIAKEARKEFLFVLSQLGVNWATLFPDIDGLSRHFNWVGANLKELEG
jgi:hypothetical protein